MKIRKGFVSNSSSSSFMIYGAEVKDYFNVDVFKNNPDYFYNIVDKLISAVESNVEVWKHKEQSRMVELCEEYLKDLKSIRESQDFDGLVDFISEDVSLLTSGTDLEFHNMMNEYWFIGKSPDRMEDNKTMKQWKKEIEEEIKELIPLNDKDFGWHEECWCDG